MQKKFILVYNIIKINKNINIKIRNTKRTIFNFKQTKQKSYNIYKCITKIQYYINKILVQILRNEDIVYKTKIKVKFLWIIHQIQHTKTHYYIFDNSLLLLRNRDIEENPGPMPNILETHPSPHRQRYKTYFITCTIKLQLEYQHPC